MFTRKGYMLTDLSMQKLLLLPLFLTNIKEASKRKSILLCAYFLETSATSHIFKDNKTEKAECVEPRKLHVTSLMQVAILVK